MRIHREGIPSLLITLLVLASLNIALMYGLKGLEWLENLVLVLSIGLFLLVLQFFRNPSRKTVPNPKHIISPADGKVVVIEETEETEYLKDQRIQVSIFMSPLNVHVNRNPVEGIVKYVQYHKGKYLVAWHPKSSTENERNTVAIQAPNGVDIVLRQIAGAVARRICCYLKRSQNVQQGAELGFIKFGSRVDIFLPTNTEVKVKIGDKVKAGETLLAVFS